MQCNKCSNQDLVFKEGTAKTGKNIGKPYKAWYCPPCKNMMFINAPQPQNRTFVPQRPQQNGLTDSQKLDKILTILKTNFPEKEIPIPFENSDEPLPF